MLKAILERNLCSQGIVPAMLTLHFQQSDFDKYAFCVQFYNIFKVEYLFWFGKILYLCCAPNEFVRNLNNKEDLNKVAVMFTTSDW